jgi:hypothetical protein
VHIIDIKMSSSSIPPSSAESTASRLDRLGRQQRRSGNAGREDSCSPEPDLLHNEDQLQQEDIADVLELEEPANEVMEEEELVSSSMQEDEDPDLAGEEDAENDVNPDEVRNGASGAWGCSTASTASPAAATCSQREPSNFSVIFQNYQQI